MTDPTPLDAAHTAMIDNPADDAARLRFYERVADVELYLLLADEPTANVDSKTAISLLSLMQKLNEDQGITFLFSTHDQHVMDRAKRIIHILDGQVESEEYK